MPTAREQMKMIEAELDRVRAEIERLKVEEALLLKMKSRMSGSTQSRGSSRRRSPSVKPLVLEIMREAGVAGATTTEVDAKVREQVPTVARDTVGSVLSRLKSDGALVYRGERYFEKGFEPSDGSPFHDRIRAVK